MFGIPDDEMGEQVKAVVELAPGVVGDDALIAELQAFCRQHLAGYKMPRTIDIADHLPRNEAGKLTNASSATPTGPTPAGRSETRSASRALGIPRRARRREAFCRPRPLGVRRKGGEGGAGGPGRVGPIWRCRKLVRANRPGFRAFLPEPIRHIRRPAWLGPLRKRQAG